MGELMVIPLDAGGSFVVQMDEDVQSGVVKAGRGLRPDAELERAAVSLESALEPIAAAARVTLAKLREANPDEVVVEFGLKLTAEVGAVITKATGECNLKVTLRWERSGEPSD